jgi:hypothetical protein
VIRHSKKDITFNHHYDFKSFNTAMRLPCTICTLAYAHAKNPPSALSWVNSVGYYDCRGDEQQLRFYPDSQEGWLKASNILVLKPWSSELYFQHKHATTDKTYMSERVQDFT